MLHAYKDVGFVFFPGVMKPIHYCSNLLAAAFFLSFSTCIRCSTAPTFSFVAALTSNRLLGFVCEHEIRGAAEQ